MTTLTLIALAIVPTEDVVREHVDLVEINHYFDDCGRKVFDQAIFYDWSPATERYEVRAWRLVKDRHQQPEYDHARGDWDCTWQDGEVVRRVQAASIRETWTQYDPELAEREYLCKEKRRELTKPAAWPR